MGTKYENDVVAWSNEQAQLIRGGKFALLDLEHIAEEIEDVGKAEQRELASRMAELLAHLLKWEYQPERQGSSWKISIKKQRAGIDRRLKKTPSLKPMLQDADWIEDIWDDALKMASKETGIEVDKFPLDCQWKLTEVVQPEWLPAMLLEKKKSGQER